MTARQVPPTRPPRTRPDRVAFAATIAVILAVAGLVAELWRPLAPSVGDVVTDLDDLPPRVLAAIRAYRTPRYAASLLSLGLAVAVPVGFLATSRGRRVVDALVRAAGSHPLRAATLVAVTITVATSAATLPVRFWRGFVHERAWGFRTQGAAGWLADVAVEEAVTLLVVAVAAPGLVAAIRRWPRSWPWRLVPAGVALAGMLVLLRPVLVQPLLLRTTPLEPGPTRERVAAVLDAAGQAEVEILVGDASRRTTKVNAFVTGIGPTRKLVLYDNLLGLPDDEIAWIVGHELGHRLHHDIPRGVLFTATGLLPSLLVLAWLLRHPGVQRRFRAAGADDPRLVAVAVAFAVVAQVLGLPMVMALSRAAERSADHAALELTGESDEMVRIARTFAIRDLADPDPPPWVVALWSTHPTVDARVRAAVAFARERGLPLPTRDQLENSEHAIRHPASR